MISWKTYSSNISYICVHISLSLCVFLLTSYWHIFSEHIYWMLHKFSWQVNTFCHIKSQNININPDYSLRIKKNVDYVLGKYAFLSILLHRVKRIFCSFSLIRIIIQKLYKFSIIFCRKKNLNDKLCLENLENFH